MANHRAKEQRTMMRVPIPFMVRVQTEAKALGISSTVYLEDKKVVPL
jgi:hypothetical protein